MRHPKCMAANELRVFLTMLATERTVSVSTYERVDFGRQAILVGEAKGGKDY